MFIDTLHQKAQESGLKEDALIPKETKKERRIYENLRQMRPQSAALGPSKEAGDLKASGKKLRDGSPTQTAMRSSFYGMSLLDDEEKAELEANDLTAKTKYEAEQERRGAVLNQLNITNILELSQKEKEVLNQIKKFMKQQESEL